MKALGVRKPLNRYPNSDPRLNRRRMYGSVSSLPSSVSSRPVRDRHRKADDRKKFVRDIKVWKRKIILAEARWSRSTWKLTTFDYSRSDYSNRYRCYFDIFNFVSTYDRWFTANNIDNELTLIWRPNFIPILKVKIAWMTWLQNFSEGQCHKTYDSRQDWLWWFTRKSTIGSI